jgi:photosystem II stability/assembly factor-like uncharacterized protein
MPSKLLVAILLCASSVVNAGTNTWTAMGPAGGGINQIVFGSAGSTVFATTSSGFYRSQDGGATWVSIKSDFMNAPTGMAVDPSDASRVYVVARDAPWLYVSTDGGATLVPVSSLPSGLSQAWQVAVSQDGRTIFVSGGAKVFRSADRGLTWTERTPISPDSLARIWRLAIDPADANRLYAGGSLSSSTYALLRSQDGGQSWQVLLSGTSAASVVTDIAVSASNPLQVWAATQGGLFRSADRGDTWSNAASGGVFAVGLSPAEPAVVYAGANNGTVIRSADSGAQWTDVTHGQGAGTVRAIAVSPVQGARVLVGGDGGLYGSLNAGASWASQQANILGTTISQISKDSATGRIYINTSVGGIHYTTSASDLTVSVDNVALRDLQGASLILGVTAMLAQPGRLLASLGTGLARSLDGGDTWTLVQVAPTGTRQLFNLASPVAEPQTLLAAGSSRLFRSTDGGNLWTQITAGIPANPNFEKVFFAPSDGRYAYASLGDTATPAYTLGIHRSTDGGVSWSAAIGNPATSLRLLAVDPVVATTLYASTQSALLKSIDGGATWSPLNWIQSEWRGAISGLAVDPRRTQTIYASSGTRIARSIDGGTSWETLRDTLVLPYWSAYEMFSDPDSAGTLLVGTGSQGVQKITIAPDLVLTGTSPAVPTGLGVPLALRFPFGNQGPFDATGVQTRVQWPASATNVTVSSSSGTCAVVANTAKCTVDIFRMGSTAVLTVTATPASAGTFEVLASIQGDQADANPVNNSVALQTNVAARADLAVTATGTATAQTGGSVSHTVTVRNAGPNTASVPSLDLQFGSGLLPASASSTQGNCSVNAASAAVTCALADLASGGAVTVTVNSSAAVAGSWGLSAHVSSSTADGSVADNSATTPTVVTQAPASSGGGGSGGGSSGGGGGGALSLWEILVLLLVVGRQQLRRVEVRVT